MKISFFIKDVDKYQMNDDTNKRQLTPFPTDFFHLETGANYAKTDGTILAEYLEGVVDDAFLRDPDNAKAYADWKESLKAPKPEPEIKEVSAPVDEVVLEDKEEEQ